MPATIKEEVGDILTVKHGIIVQGCNIQGVMGSGLAKQIREMYPEVYEDYRMEYMTEVGLKLGQVIYTHVGEDNHLLIASCMTQEYYGRDKNVMYVDYMAINNSLHKVFNKARHMRLPVHIPQIGAGYGNGKWPIIKERILQLIQPENHVTFWTLP